MNEKRKLIYADDLLAQFPVGGGVTAARARRAIEKAETVDAEEVTRCEKCVYWKTDGCAMATTDKVTRAIGWSNGDDYCSYGERGEGHNGKVD